MAQMNGKFTINDSLNDLKIRLRNNQPLRARNAANSADISIIKVNASDAVEFLQKPQSSTAPTVGNDLVNKTYADSLIGGGGESLLKTPVAAIARVATDAATYAAGVLTADANGALTVDSHAAVNGDLILLTAQANQIHNGLYEVTDAGSGATPFILTRPVGAEEGDTAKLGTMYFARLGAIGGFSFWQTLPDALIGTDNIGYAWAGLTIGLANVGPIEANLTPDADISRSLGAVGFRWTDLFATNIKD